jgi:hypothetical protein
MRYPWGFMAYAGYVLCRYTRFSGFHGVIAGLLVAVKQIMPDQEVKMFGTLKLRARVS